MNDEAVRLNKITDTIIGSAISVHKELGPGLLESAYEACLLYELTQQGLMVSQQKPLPFIYREISIDCGYHLDLLVEDSVIVEIKAVENILSIHRAQVMSYLKISGCSVGLLINFNVQVLKQGIVRLVNKFPDTHTCTLD